MIVNDDVNTIGFTSCRGERERQREREGEREKKRGRGRERYGEARERVNRESSEIEIARWSSSSCSSPTAVSCSMFSDHVGWHII